MNKKVIFIDIDGTLVGHDNGIAKIPQSAIDAIRKARQLGHYVYLSTGRSLAEIYDYILDIGFDGIIGAAGGYIEHCGKVLYHQKLSYEQIKKITDYFNHNNIYYYLEGNDGLYCNHIFLDFLKDIVLLGNYEESDFYHAMKSIDTCSLDSINKITFMSQSKNYETIFKNFEDEFQIVRASWLNVIGDAGEISLKGINKASAIKKLMNHLQIDMKNTVAIGDSMNDKEMFECCHIAIAMEKAEHGVEKYADFITKDIFDDGIEYALKYYKII